MIRHDRIINSLIHGDAVHKLAAEKNIGLTEARLLLSQMSFKEYCSLGEASADIVPPSGQTIAPTTGQSQPASTAPKTTTGPTPTGKPDPRGVQVRNPKTGQMEWMLPAAANQASQGGAPVQGNQPVAEEDDGLSRLKELAGIKEDASCGATGAGAIAIAPAAMGGVKRRQPTDEELKKEYTPKEAPKTIVGDTKPGQAMGELSSNLAVRGKKTASRNNNGFKK